MNAFEQDGLTVAETQFTLKGANYVYRTASTSEVTLTDISGEAGTYAENTQSKVLWCDAQVYFTQGGSGKILWLDVVPGLVYSLRVESGASSAKPSGDASPAPDSSPDPATEQPTESGDTPALAASYDEILSKYGLALSQQWDGETLIENDMSLFLLGKSESEVGYCLLDVNGDGADELLVGSRTGAAYPDQIIFDLYTMQDDTPVHVCSGQERDRYYLYQDEAAPDAYFFYNENSSSAFESGYLSLHLDGQTLSVDQAVLYNAERDRENPWFSGREQDGAVSIDQPMEEALAKSIIESYQSALIEPPFVSFSDK